ncbi:MAG: NPCBM/NEW2 domain-containing protein [Spirochaetes bacterium]|nr:NPCBM/NEW2 domain-containing protein [Spirochaetota bacterium]
MHSVNRHIHGTSLPASLIALIAVMSVSSILFAQSPGKAPVEDDEGFFKAMMTAKGGQGDETSAASRVRQLYEGENIVKGTDPAERVTIDLNGAKNIYLLVTAPNGNGSAHAVWGEPYLIDADGKRKELTKLKPKSSKVGWAKLEFNSFEGKPLAVKDKTFSFGIYAHADSYVHYELDKEYAQLIVYVGINNSSKGGGAVKFMVMQEPPGMSRLNAAENIYPRHLKKLKEGFGKDFDKWVTAKKPDVEKKAIDAIVKNLGERAGDIPSRLAALSQAQGYDAAQWLSLYFAAVERMETVTGVRDGLAVTKRIIQHFAAKDKRESLYTELRELDTAQTAALKEDTAACIAFSQKVDALRRKALFTHPGLQFDDLLINKRQPPLFSHNSDQYLARHSRISPGLVVLKNWKSLSMTLSFLTRDRLPPGSILHPDLSFDGKKVLFSFADHREAVRDRRAFFIYEADVDGSSIRQVTGTTNDRMDRVENRTTFVLEDFDPCYLPDGGFIFTSTRSQNIARCHAGRYNPASLLYRGELDGTGIRPVTFGEANEIDPSVMNDGRIVYNRWEYVNRHDCKFHALWTIYPDGARTANFYKNLSTQPLSVTEPKAVPGSDKVMAIATAHHSFNAGTVLLIDPNKGDEGETPLVHLTPEVQYPECQGYPESTYAEPYPITEDLFFAAYSDVRHIGQGQVQYDNAYRICLVYNIDGKAYREEIYRDPDISCFEPIPLAPRKKPAVIPSSIKAENPPTGTMFLQNVYESTQPIDRGSIAYLRINEIFNQPTPKVPHRSWVMDEVPKQVLGIVPVEKDGSAFFRVPSGKAFQIQALDSKSMAVMTMRSFVYSHPGENQSCIGCHESRTAAPPTAVMPSVKAPRDLLPPPGPAQDEGFNYVSQVQPVLDRYCIRCHGLDNKADGKVNLLGDYIVKNSDRYPSGPLRMPRSYWTFFSIPGMIKMADRNLETPFSKPKDYFSHTSRLPAILSNGHNGVHVDDDSWKRIITWLDLNAQLYGNFSWNRREDRVPSKEGEEKLRSRVKELFGDAMAEAPFSALVNNGTLTESRILKAPLAASAGGWGQLTPAWESTNDASFLEMQSLVERSLTPLPYRDIAGTCGRGAEKCVCGSCWVRSLVKR